MIDKEQERRKSERKKERKKPMSTCLRGYQKIMPLITKDV
jgi:hypothetical protein